jgi:hypothetical protein
MKQRIDRSDANESAEISDFNNITFNDFLNNRVEC